MNTAEKKLEWIKEQIAAGRTVYLSTHTRITKIKGPHLKMLRVNGEVLEVLTGSQGWLNHNYSKLSAS